jgi:hypothetical protein
MPFILACKELNGGVYITRLPKAIDDQTPGIPDNWYFVGPGLRPSIQEYNGTKFVLTFDYLSHLNCRIVDIATWPPQEVVPITSPPTITIGSNTTGSGAPQDSLTLKVSGGSTTAVVAPFFNPPVLQQPLLFLDPNTNTYSVTIQPVTTYFPQAPALITSPAASNTQVFFRFYARPFPYTGPWILQQDWTLENYVFNVPTQPLFSFPFASVGSLRYQFTVTWGNQFSETDQWNPAAHMEGIPGEISVTVDSTVQHANAQATINESLSLFILEDPTTGVTSTETFVVVSPRQAFINEGPTDLVFPTLTYVNPSNLSSQLLVGSNSFAFFDTRQAFVYEQEADSLDFSVSTAQGNTLQAVMG